MIRGLLVATVAFFLIVPGFASAAYTRNLTIGDSGADVSSLQTFLIADGYSVPAGATGYFGAETQTALAAYQRDHAITPSVGYFGPITRAAFSGSFIGTTANSTLPILQMPGTTFTRNLTLGDTGSDVLALQQFLNTHGFPLAATGPGSPGNETDYFGQLTARTLAEYQGTIGLPNTGYFGPLTRADLEAVLQANPATTTSSTPTPSGTSTTTTSVPTVPSGPTGGGGGSSGGGGGGSSGPTVSVPTMSTQSATAVAATTATLNGDIIDIGNADVTTRGFVYGTTTAYTATTTESGTFSTGAYTTSVTSLTCNMTYHVAAYAENSAGTSYGSDTTFTTSACPSFDVPDQTLEFGTLTLAGEGSTTPTSTGTISTSTIIAGNGAGHWQISSTGVLTPTSAGVTAGLNQAPYSLTILFGDGTHVSTTTITIDTRADTYTVASPNELLNVLNLNEATKLSGNTIELRPGYYGTRGVINFYGHFTQLTSTLTVTSASTTDTAEINYWAFAATSPMSNVTFRYIHFYRTQADIANESVPDLMNLGGTTSNIQFYNDEFSSDMGPARLGTERLASIRALDCTGTCQNLIVENSTFHNLVYGMELAGTNILAQGNEFYDLWADPFDLAPLQTNAASDGIIIRDNIAHDIDGDDNQLHPDFIQAYARSPHYGDLNNVQIIGNVVYPGYEGVRQIPALLDSSSYATTTSDYTFGTTQNNHLAYMNATSTDLTVTLPSASAAGNKYSVGVVKFDSSTHTVTVVPAAGDTINGASSYTLTAPMEGIQFSSDGTSNYTISLGGPVVDGILLQNLGYSGNYGTYNGWVIEGNVFMVSGNGGITSDYVMRNTLVRNNTVMRDWTGDVNGDGVVNIEDGFVSYNLGIRLDGDDTTVAEYNEAETVGVIPLGTYSSWELTQGFVGSPLLRNNDSTTNFTGISSYQSVYQGTTFDPQTKDDTLAQALMKANGPLDVDNSGGPSFGDIGALGTTESNGFYDFTNEATSSAFFTKPVLSDAYGLGTSTTDANISVNTDVSDGTMYYVVSTSSSTPSATQIEAGEDASGTAAPGSGSFAVSSVGAQNATSTTLTESTKYYVFFVQVGANGGTSNISASPSFRTLSSGYNENPVTFSSAWLTRGADLTGATNATTSLIFLSFYAPSSFAQQSTDIISEKTSGNYVSLYTGTTTATTSAWIYTRWQNSAGGSVVIMNGSTHVQAGDRVNILISMTAGGTSYEYVWTSSSGVWTLDASYSNASSYPLELTPGDWIIPANTTGGSSRFTGTMVRIAMWQGIVLPDISSATVQNNFSDSSTGLTVDPSTSTTAYGTPIIDFYGDASTWSAGTNEGSGGNFTLQHGSITNTY